jgi:hypothetical protein
LLSFKNLEGEKVVDEAAAKPIGDSFWGMALIRFRIFRRNHLRHNM